jgi:proteic killer suppression protein
MDVEFADPALKDLEANPKAGAGYPPGVVKGFRKAMQAIRSAVSEQDLYAMKGLRFEKLEGKRKGQRSMRCNNQYRIILTIDERDRRKVFVVEEITDYH